MVAIGFPAMPWPPVPCDGTIDGGILFCYLLTHARPVEGKTLNAVLAETLFDPWRFHDFRIGFYLLIES